MTLNYCLNFLTHLLTKMLCFVKKKSVPILFSYIKSNWIFQLFKYADWFWYIWPNLFSVRNPSINQNIGHHREATPVTTTSPPPVSKYTYKIYQHNRPLTKLSEGNVFSCVCLSVHGVSYVTNTNDAIRDADHKGSALQTCSYFFSAGPLTLVVSPDP